MICFHVFYLHARFIHALSLQSPSHYSTETTKHFKKVLQSSCHQPHDLLENIGQHLSSKNDRDGEVSSLSLVRLAKLLITLDNRQFESDWNQSIPLLFHASDIKIIDNIFQVLASSLRCQINHNTNRLDALVEGIKAGAVVSRILHRSSFLSIESVDNSVLEYLVDTCNKLERKSLEPHHVSGLIWSFDTYDLQLKGLHIPKSIQNEYEEMNIPFRVRPGFFTKHASNQNNIQDLTLDNLKQQVSFQKEQIITQNNQRVQERRETAWQGEDFVPEFAYSGKRMERKEFSPVVRNVRDYLRDNMGSYYDCCLLNLYPDGDSGMRYHSDPDQGTVWGKDTSVVSVGATRRFSFRHIPSAGMKNVSQPHNFVVMDGDVTHMFDECQFLYQHAVKTADTKGNEKASRSSLVFKQYIQ